MPLFKQRGGLPAVRVCFKIKAVGQLGRHGARKVRLDAGLRDRLRLRVREEVEVADGGHAEAQTLRDREQRRCLDAARVHPRLARENALRQPVGTRQLLAVAAQQRHRQMRVAVDEPRHQDHARAVNDVLRLLLRGLFAHIGDLSAGDADKGVDPDGHPLVHGDDGNVRE